MNKRIRELANQARRYAFEQNGNPQDPTEWSTKYYNEMFDEKFAELIVRECADVARGWTDVYVVEDNASRQIDEFIKKEFGVKE